MIVFLTKVLPKQCPFSYSSKHTGYILGDSLKQSGFSLNLMTLADGRDGIIAVYSKEISIRNTFPGSDFHFSSASRACSGG
jgi:hypothetical protein